MTQSRHQSQNTGFNDFEQVFMRVQAAEQMVGAATVTMDPETMDHATTAVEQARAQLESAKAQAVDLDEPFLMDQEEKLARCEHQLLEAKR
ncbi:DUF2564 family protein [Ectobacillus ponti]|uniref:DUF2564 family protein n=1 Tax=Ectobacillus ponti TaxID=2961894 RepID=A0AA41XB65_9BACI|nr:DUF2564 family protein [Ectobacillus ponti]MCP8968821.1 DUF2564 family protein [Ectobacillus ponti]